MTDDLARMVADATGIPEHMRTAPAAEALRCLDAHDGHTCTGPVEYRHAISGTGASFPRCDGAWGAALDRRDRVRRDYPDSPVPPRWFTEQGGEAYAGERWDEDD